MLKRCRQDHRFRGHGSSRCLAAVLIALGVFGALGVSTPLAAQSDFALPGAYGFKIYQVSNALYPFVQVYFRTFDSDMLPLVNLNERNVGLMVKGRAYDPMKQQYAVQSIRQRQEAVRSVIVLDASKSMAGPPFEAALRACARFIDSKRPQDEVSVLSIRDTKSGYDLVSEFERDPGALGRRLADVRPDGMKTRLYDSIGAAMQACGMVSQGSISPASPVPAASCSVVVFSDGNDEGSAVSREELNARISNLAIPIPIYSLAYSKVNPKYFKNLEAISKNSFGKYYLIAEAFDRMTRVVEEIQNILQSDYVLTFRSYVPVDGENHSIKLGLEYPTGSGKYTYENAQFEAIQPPPLPLIMQKTEELNRLIPELPEGTTPFLGAPTTAAAPKAAMPALPQAAKPGAQ